MCNNMSSVGRYWENIILAVGKVQRHTCEYAETGVDLMKRKELIVAVVLALICLVIFGGGAFAAEPAKQIAYWGIYTGNAGGQGVAVEGVMGASAAQAAGLQKGDVLLSINGVAVRSPQEFTILKNTFPLYTPLKLAIKRAGATVELQIEVSGIVPLEVKPVKTEFIIPGVPAAPEAPALGADERSQPASASMAAAVSHRQARRDTPRLTHKGFSDAEDNKTFVCM